MTTTTYPASQAQHAFIADLLANRAVPEALVVTIKAELPTMTSRQASPYIDLLKALPRKPKPVAAGDGVLTAAYDAVANARYAIPTDMLRYAFPETSLPGDYLFIKVDVFKGTRYMRRLTGGGEHGSFVTSRLETRVVLALLKVIAPRQLEFTQNFGREFSCCGRCGRSLTDPISRKALLGPECRGSFGL